MCAWSSPPDFVAGNVVTETELDSLSADLFFLLNGWSMAKIVRDNSGNYTTTSTTFADVDATNLILTMTLQAGRAFVHATFMAATDQVNGDGAEFDIIADSLTRAGHATHGLVRLRRNSGTLMIHVMGMFTGLSTGSHTFKLQYRSLSAGTTTIAANAAATTTTDGSVVTMYGWGF